MNKDYFEWYKWNDMIAIAEDPVGFHTDKALSEDKTSIYWKQKYERIRKGEEAQ